MRIVETLVCYNAEKLEQEDLGELKQEKIKSFCNIVLKFIENNDAQLIIYQDRLLIRNQRGVYHHAGRSKRGAK